MRSNLIRIGLLASCLTIGGVRAETNPVGSWAFDDFWGGANWIGVEKRDDGSYGATFMRLVGSPDPQYDVSFDGMTLTMYRKTNWEKEPEKLRIRRTKLRPLPGEKVELPTGLVRDGKPVTLRLDKAEVTMDVLDGTGKQLSTGKSVAFRNPPVGPKPDLSKLVFGEPVNLTAGGLDGWQAVEPKAHFGWTFKDGVLSNRVRRNEKGEPCSGGANLRTKRADFRDFKLNFDVRIPPGCNSGVYLRGIYEVQVFDSYGMPRDSHRMAAIYSRICPSVNAEKPANEWQHVEAILADRHATVVLNGVKIIDNEPIAGITGGALRANEFNAGPMCLQGNHSDADFRNMILTPILKGE